jgi:hypothetical protein
MTGLVAVESAVTAEMGMVSLAVTLRPGLEVRVALSPAQATSLGDKLHDAADDASAKLAILGETA